MGFLREPSHLLVVAIVIILLFGYKRLPDASRGIARSLRIFKSEMKQMKDDDKPPARPDRTDEPGQPLDAVQPLEGKVVRPPARSDQPYGETPRNL